VCVPERKTNKARQPLSAKVISEQVGGRFLQESYYGSIPTEAESARLPVQKVPQVNPSPVSMDHSALILHVANLHPLRMQILVSALEDADSVPLGAKVLWSVLVCLKEARK
jgi:hypothetical protein